MSTRNRRLLFGAVVLLLLMTACAPSANSAIGTTASSGHIAGFWQGLWHGIIAPITFIISLFNNGVNIYDVHNNGNWYNTGFMLGAGILAKCIESRKHIVYVIVR